MYILEPIEPFVLNTFFLFAFPLQLQTAMRNYSLPNVNLYLEGKNMKIYNRNHFLQVKMHKQVHVLLLSFRIHLPP